MNKKSNKVLVAFFILLVFMFIVICVSFVARAHAAPQEPPLSELHRWYPVQDGTVILEYRIVNKYAVQIWRFKHAQKAVAVKIPVCNEAKLDGDEIHLLTQEAKPSLYLIEKHSDGFSPDFNLDFFPGNW